MQGDNIKQETLSTLDNAKFRWFHVKTCLVSGIGFYTDAYDLFIISIATSIIGYVYYPETHKVPTNLDTLLKTSALVGTLIGQLLFGYLSDLLGRKKMYGVELIIIVVTTFNQCFAANTEKGMNVIEMLILWRFFLGIGIGGDYPLSAIITSEFANTKNRGAMIAAVFAMQGFGILTGSITSLVTLAAFKNLIAEDVLYLDYVWRIIIGLGAIWLSESQLTTQMIIISSLIMNQQSVKVMNSSFFKIWKLIIAHNPGSSGWQYIITLQKLLAVRENNEYSDYKVIEVISQQVQFLKLDQMEIDSSLVVLKCFAAGHPVQVSMMIRSLMEDLMKRFDNRSTSLHLYSLFINITSYQHDDVPTNDSPEFHLVKLGILEQIDKNIQRIQEEYDEIMLRKIVHLLNNMLTENIDRVSQYVLNFIPVFCSLINDHFDSRLVEELLLFIKFLTKSRTNAYIIANNLIFFLAKFLVADPSLLVKILEIIFIYDGYSQDLKTMLIYDIEQHQFEASMNFAYDKWPEAEENLSIIEKYIGLIEDWRYIIKP